jgi:hypothetical protein
VSSVTFAEIRVGGERLDDAAHRAALHDWLTNALRPINRRSTGPAFRAAGTAA